METKERNRLRSQALRAGLSDHHTCMIENAIDQFRSTGSDKHEMTLFTRVIDHPDVDTIMQFFQQYKSRKR